MRRRVVLGLIVVLTLAARARAQGPTAAQILDRARQASALGLVGAQATIRLDVDDGHGQKKERRLSASAIALPGGEVRRLVKFEEPADVRGVALLVVEKPGSPPERLLYLPTQRRVRHVSRSAGGGRFLETDFSYADLDLAGGAEDTSERLADQTLDGNLCFVVATKPAHSPYGKIETWVDQKTGVTLKVVFQNSAGQPLKELDVARVRQVDGRWYAFESVMRTLAAGSNTTLTIEKLDPRAKLTPDDFTSAALGRP